MNRTTSSILAAIAAAFPIAVCVYEGEWLKVFLWLPICGQWIIIAALNRRIELLMDALANKVAKIATAYVDELIAEQEKEGKEAADD